MIYEITKLEAKCNQYLFVSRSVLNRKKLVPPLHVYVSIPLHVYEHMYLSLACCTSALYQRTPRKQPDYIATRTCLGLEAVGCLVLLIFTHIYKCLIALQPVHLHSIYLMHACILLLVRPPVYLPHPTVVISVACARARVGRIIQLFVAIVVVVYFFPKCLPASCCIKMRLIKIKTFTHV